MGGKHTAFNTMYVLTTYPEQYQYICSDCGHRWTGFKAQSIGPMQSWPDLEFENITPIGQMGWICPKCGRVYSPSTNQCFHCGGGFSPNIVYCGTNGTFPTREVMDTISISSNPTVSVSTNEIVNKMAEDAMKTVSQIRPVK